MQTGPQLPYLDLGDATFEVSGITGHGASRATFALSTSTELRSAGSVTREAVVKFALDLLHLSGQMIDDGAYATSDTIRDGIGHVSARHNDGLLRYYRLRDRLVILQLAQRVLEKAPDDTANTLLSLLAHAETTGIIPINVVVDLKTAENDELGLTSQLRDPAEPTH